MYVMKYSEHGTLVSVLRKHARPSLRAVLGSTLGALPHEARGGVSCWWCHFGSQDVSEFGAC